MTSSATTTATATMLRDSNIELLRIVAMAMIVLGHFFVHGAWGWGYGNDSLWTVPPESSTVSIAAYCFVVCGVNLFILISGYCRIKLRWKSLINLWLLCVAYNLLYLPYLIHTDQLTVYRFIKIFTISSVRNWFFPAYLGLMILSPIINKGIDNLTRASINKVAILLILFTCVSCVFLNNGAVRNGYNCLYMCIIYVIGSFIGCYNEWGKSPRLKKRYCLTTYIVSCLLLGLVGIAARVANVGSGNLSKLFAYNNILTIVASIALFMFFTQLKIKSKPINHIASTVVGALLLQDYVTADLVYPKLYDYITTYGATMEFVLTCAALYFGYFIAAFIIESVRRPIAKRITNVIIDKWMSPKVRDWLDFSH